MRKLACCRLLASCVRSGLAKSVNEGHESGPIGSGRIGWGRGPLEDAIAEWLVWAVRLRRRSGWTLNHGRSNDGDQGREGETRGRSGWRLPPSVRERSGCGRIAAKAGRRADVSGLVDGASSMPWRAGPARSGGLERRRRSGRVQMRAMLAKWAWGARKAARTVAVGPLRCLATMISAVPRSALASL